MIWPKQNECIIIICKMVNKTLDALSVLGLQPDYCSLGCHQTPAFTFLQAPSTWYIHDSVLRTWLRLCQSIWYQFHSDSHMRWLILHSESAAHQYHGSLVVSESTPR